MNKYWDTLEKSANIAKEREEDYGDVRNNFKEMKDVLFSMFGINMSVEDICKVLIALKVARQKNKHKDDNLDDLINYVAILKFLSADEE